MKNLNTKKLFIYKIISNFIPPSKGHKFKTRMLRWCGAEIGKNVEIFSSAKFYGNFKLKIGDNVFIGHDAFIFGAKDSIIELESFSKLGSRTIVVTGSHEFSIEGDCIEGKGIYKNVKICRGSAVSTGSIILPGKIVGEMSHIAAGSVVTHDVPPYTRVAGVPAKIIKNFKEEQ